jgi:hypothetical protein
MPRTLLVTFGLAGTLLVLAAPAAAERPFGARFSENHAGNIAVVGNTLMTCPSADLACGPAQQGDAVNNNSFAMEYVNVDADPTTFSSSSAQLALPAGARVLFAGLYYGGRTSAGAGGAPAPNAAARGTVRMQTPGAAGYEDVAAAADDSTRVGAS